VVRVVVVCCTGSKTVSLSCTEDEAVHRLTATLRLPRCL